MTPQFTLMCLICAICLTFWHLFVKGAEESNGVVGFVSFNLALLFGGAFVACLVKVIEIGIHP